MKNSDIHYNLSKGIECEEDLQIAYVKYGHCNIEIPRKGIPRLMVEEVLNPFYIF